MESQKKFDKNTLAIIFYLIHRLDGILGKTHLQKLLFLVDLFAIRKLEQQITVMKYKRYLHGPYSSILDEYTNHLSELGHIEAKEFPYNRGKKPKIYTRYYSKKNISIREELLNLIGADKLLIVDEVADSFGNISLQKLLDIVYNLPIMKNSEINDILDFTKKIGKPTNNEEEDSLSFE